MSKSIFFNLILQGHYMEQLILVLRLLLWLPLLLISLRHYHKKSTYSKFELH